MAGKVIEDPLAARAAAARALEPPQDIGEVARRNADLLQPHERVPIGLFLEGARIAGLHEHRRHRDDDRAERSRIAEERGDEGADTERLEREPQAVPISDVADLVREYGDDLVVVLRQL